MRKGRPRSFDPEEALESALNVFWRKGYEGTSLTDLTRAMGLNRPSIYAAFGNKEALFRQVFDRYIEKNIAFMREAMSEPSSRGAIERYLGKVVSVLSDTTNPRGCLAVQGALSCGDDADPIKQELIKKRAAGEALIRERLERAESEGDLPPHANPIDLARYIATMTQGMAVQAASGATRSELQNIADMALLAWP